MSRDDHAGVSIPELAEHILDYVVQVDSEGRIQYANHVPKDLEVVGTLAASHLDGAHSRLFRASLERARRGQIQAREVCYKGRWYAVRCVPLSRENRVVGATLIATDIHDRKQTEDALRASEQNAQALLAALPDMVLRIRADGVVLDYKAERIAQLAASADNVIGCQLSEVLPQPACAVLSEAIVTALMSGEMQMVEYQLELPVGLQDFEARIVASERDEVVSVVRNITDKKQLERKLAAADRLSSLGTLAAGVAHEINNPLAYQLLNLSSAAKLLANMEGEQPPGRETLHALRSKVGKSLEGAQHIRDIVTNIGAFTRSAERSQPLRVDDVLDWALAMIEGELRKSTTVVREYRDVPLVLASRQHLGQVFLNLMLNAWQAFPEPSEGHELRDRTIKVCTAHKEGRVIVGVRDSGRGIAPEHRARIFDPFFTTKEDGVGTGLGLWVSHNIIASYGGNISIDSQLGAGTLVQVSLPAAS